MKKGSRLSTEDRSDCAPLGYKMAVHLPHDRWQLVGGAATRQCLEETWTPDGLICDTAVYYPDPDLPGQTR